LSKWLADLEERAKAIRKRIPDEPQGAEFLRLLTSSADQEGVKILNFRTGAPAPQEGLSKLTLELTLEGDYPNLCGFFDRLARIPRVATVDKLNLEGLTESSQYPVEMTLVLYFGMRTAGGAARRNRHDAT
jgi:Tfp pilus assembly protein PilO